MADSVKKSDRRNWKMAAIIAVLEGVVHGQKRRFNADSVLVSKAINTSHLAEL